MSEAKNDWPEGIKRTKQREAVLTVLDGAEKPMSATDICSRIEKTDESSAWLSTVYRILEFFVKKGIVTRLAVMTGEKALYEMNRFQHKHYAVCVGCRKIISMNNCPMERFIPKLEDDDFHVMGHNLEVYGYCKECGAKR